jgi:hypothetical protein
MTVRPISRGMVILEHGGVLTKNVFIVLNMYNPADIPV